MKHKLFIITGPTASGKTAASVSAARLMNAEIISADAIQLYKKLDIGSAKPTEEERRGIVHHMMDCIEPDEPRFTVPRRGDRGGKRDNCKRKKAACCGRYGLIYKRAHIPAHFFTNCAG